MMHKSNLNGTHFSLVCLSILIGLFVGLACAKDDGLFGSCGDGKVQKDLGEQCDDGKATETCSAECSILGCGNGVIEGAEQCDDFGESETCNSDCTFSDDAQEGARQAVLDLLNNQAYGTATSPYSEPIVDNYADLFLAAFENYLETSDGYNLTLLTMLTAMAGAEEDDPIITIRDEHYAILVETPFWRDAYEQFIAAPDGDGSELFVVTRDSIIDTLENELATSPANYSQETIDQYSSVKTASLLEYFNDFEGPGPTDVYAIYTGADTTFADNVNTLSAIVGGNDSWFTAADVYSPLDLDTEKTNNGNENYNDGYLTGNSTSGNNGYFSAFDSYLDSNSAGTADCDTSFKALYAVNFSADYESVANGNPRDGGVDDANASTAYANIVSQTLTDIYDTVYQTEIDAGNSAAAANVTATTCQSAINAIASTAHSYALSSGAGNGGFSAATGSGIADSTEIVYRDTAICATMLNTDTSLQILIDAGQDNPTNNDIAEDISASFATSFGSADSNIQSRAEIGLLNNSDMIAFLEQQLLADENFSAAVMGHLPIIIKLIDNLLGDPIFVDVLILELLEQQTFAGAFSSFLAEDQAMIDFLEPLVVAYVFEDTE